MTLHGSGGATVLEAAVPFQQLRELFNVNHFIISQASPYLAPWLHFKDAAPKRSKIGTKVRILQYSLPKYVCSLCSFPCHWGSIATEGSYKNLLCIMHLLEMIAFHIANVLSNLTEARVLIGYYPKSVTKWHITRIEERN